MTRICGKPRKYTDAQVAAVRAWRPLHEVCRDLGIPLKAGWYLRKRNHKGPSPENRK